MPILPVRSLTALNILLLFSLSQAQSLINFVCRRKPSLDFCLSNIQSRRPVTPPPVFYTLPHSQLLNNRGPAATMSNDHHIDGFHSSRHRISEPRENMQEDEDRHANDVLNTPSRFSSRNAGNENMASLARHSTTSQSNSNKVDVRSELGVGPTSSRLGVGMLGLGDEAAGLFGIGSSTSVNAPFVGSIGVSSGLSIG